MRRASCPEISCRRPLLFHPSSKYVNCRACASPSFPVAQLRDVVDVGSVEEEIECIYSKASFLEKSGGISLGRARLANRMIDGVNNYFHYQLLWDSFDNYGVTPDGSVKKLSEMGHAEPIGLTRISDYAFGIRKEHLDVAEYGCDRGAVQYLWNAISAIGQANGKRIEDGVVLVPLSSVDDSSWPWNSASLVSRACVGREVFARRMAGETIEHLKRYAEVYKKRSNYDRAVWSQIEAADPGRLYSLEYSPSCDLDLAALANSMCRTILLLDANQPYVVNVFLPFLRQPSDCCDRDGRKRSPLVLAWSSQAHLARVAMVAMAGAREISPVRLPRHWFKPVWGVSDEEEAKKLLTEYLEFDDQKNCLIANGKYFRPEHLRRCVMAFEKATYDREGIVPHFLAEFGEDDGKPLLECVDSVIMMASVEDRLWRCVKCERVCAAAKSCQGCNSTSHLRRQCVDGSIEYNNGDHTQTPAPNSWCFTKRKHFWNGVEYDNAAQSFEMQFLLGGTRVRDQVLWFSGESDPSLSSDVRQLVRDLIRKHSAKGSDAIALAKSVKTQIAERTNDDSPLLQHKIDHLRQSLINCNTDSLLDGRTESSTEGTPAALLALSPSIESILDDAHETYKHYIQTNASLLLTMTAQGASPTLDALYARTEQIQQMKDEATYEALDRALKGCDQEQRWRRLCSKKELFRFGGFYYFWVYRLGFKKPKHFKLPLLGNVNFTLSDVDHSLVVCLFGDHLPVHESVETVCFVMSDPDNYEAICDYECCQ